MKTISFEEKNNEDHGFMKTYKGNGNDEGKTKARNKDKYEDKDKPLTAFGR